MLPFRAVAIPLLDFVTWLQLLLVVAICVDRAGHICRPLRYTYNITACKTTTVLLMCTAIPILLLELPYVIAAFSTIGYYKREFGAEESSIAFKCDSSRDFDQSGQERISESDIFMSKLQRNFNHRSLSSIQYFSRRLGSGGFRSSGDVIISITLIWCKRIFLAYKKV